MSKPAQSARFQIDAKSTRTSPATLPAFTLIELLTVISIIALLTSIMVSSITKAKIQAKEVICRSNLREFGFCWKMYAAENNGRLMERGCGSSDGAVTWFHSIRRYYYATLDLLLCPMALKTDAQGGENPYMAWEDTIDAGLYYKGSYGVNLWVANGDSGCDSAGPNFNAYSWKTPNTRGVAYAPLQLCSQWKDMQPYPTDSPPAHEWDMWTTGPAHEMRRACIKRHPPYHVQVLFLDFSVDERTIKQLWRLKWHKEWPPNDPLPIWPDWMSDVPDPD